MHAVLGRDDELARVAALLARGRGALVLEGEPGIGKTTLWRAAVDEARAGGRRVLPCSASSAETRLSFSGLRDLLEEAFDEVADELPPPQRRALEVTLLRRDAGPAAPEQGAIAAALLSALRAVAAAGPTLLALDDAQWLDPASRIPLAYALRRLRDEPVATLIAQRPGADDLVPEPDRIRLQQLSVGAVGRILGERTGTAFPRSTLQRLHAASGGNPFHALELARALLAAPQDLGRPLRPGAVLPVPDDLRVLVKERLLALPAETVEALSFAAAAARPTLELLAAALGREPLLAAAVDAGVADVDGDDVRFAHPLYATAVYELLGRSRRVAVHARLADVVEEPEERSRHLALGTRGADEPVAAAIEAAAVDALTRGAPASAAQLAGESVRLTPPGTTDAGLRRTLLEADAHFASGDAAAALALLDRLAEPASAGHARAQVLSRRARVRHFAEDIEGGIALLREALLEAEPGSALQAEIEEGLAWGLLLARRDLEQAAGYARSAAASAEARADEAALAEALAIGALLELALGRPWEETMRRALAHEPATLGLRVLRQPSFALGYCLSCADELDGAREVFVELERRANESGDAGSMPSILNHLTLVECLAGRWDAALAHADEGLARALEGGHGPTHASILAKRALVTARRGRVDEARTLATAALDIAGFTADAPRAALARGGETAIWALGVAELAAGDAERAVELLAPMCAALVGAGVAEPGEVRALPDLVEAYATLGRRDDAEPLAVRLEAWAERLRRPSATGAARRCRALLLDGEASLVPLTEAAAAYGQTALPFERARTLLDLGTQLRRARRRRDARAILHEARAIFVDLGAPFWSDRADAELARIGGRSPGSADGLTPAEERVAALVADGRTNREVAAELVLSVHTVEAALTSIYRKLDVRSRTELARRLNV